MPSSTDRKDPLTVFMFKVSIDDSDVDINTNLDQPTAYFNKVSGLKNATDVQPYSEGGNTAFQRQMMGKTTWTNITLQQGMANDMRFFEWAVNNPCRANITIEMMGPDNTTVCSWTVRQAYPVKWTGPNFDAGQDQLAMETLEVVHEGFDIERPAPPQPAPPPPPPSPPIDAVVNFPTSGSSVPKPNAALDAIANQLKNDPTKTVKIQGHTDSDGAHGMNVSLSQSRADSVKKYLIDGGTPSNQISEATGYGPDHPIGSNSTSSGKAQNRRTTVKDTSAPNDWE